MSEINKPYLGLSSVRLTTLINKSNPDQAPLRLGTDFQFGSPHPTTESGYNTRVRLQNLNPEGSDQDIFYNRLGLDVLADLPEGFVSKVAIGSYDFTIHGAINAINAALGLNLKTDEVVDHHFTTPQAKYPLTIGNRGSLAWLDDTTYFFELYSPEVELHTVWQVTFLDGLYPPAKIIRNRPL